LPPHYSFNIADYIKLKHERKKIFAAGQTACLLIK